MFLSFQTARDHLLFGAFLIEGGSPSPVFLRIIGEDVVVPRWSLTAEPSTAAWIGEHPADPPIADLYHSVTFPPADLEEAVNRVRAGGAKYPTAEDRRELIRRLLDGPPVRP